MKLRWLLWIVPLLLAGCQWPWHARVKIDPGETKAESKVVETPAPTKRTSRKYRVIIRPGATSRPAVEEVPRD